MRVADIHAAYDPRRSRGAQFLPVSDGISLDRLDTGLRTLQSGRAELEYEHFSNLVILSCSHRAHAEFFRHSQ